MRWIWIDRILELERGKRCVAIKNVSLAEDVLHDPLAPVPAPGSSTPGSSVAGAGPASAALARRHVPMLPNTLIIEGMAQTAGLLVGHANDFKEKVVLAKIGRAVFTAVARPGYTLRYTAVIERIDASGASTSGKVEILDPALAGPAASPAPLAAIELMFSHIDKNVSGLIFPEHNFVFTEQFLDMVKNF